MDENIGYNGAYTGSQIDAAIGAVRDKETTWDGKQDKLTGVQGQVVGFDDEGDAVAMPAPDTGVTTFNGRTGAVTPQAGDYTAAMVGARGDDWTPTADDVGAIPAPEGGTAGQVLTKTVDGEAWQDAPSGLPDGGTEGQMLYKSADGAEWGDKPVMYVNITGDDEATIADKTFSEITEAVQNGFTVYAKADTPEGTIVLPLSMQTEQSLFFTVLIETVLAVAVITEQYVVLDNIRLDATHIEFVPSSGITSDNVQDAIEEVRSHIPTDYIPTSQKGAASGVAELDSTGRVPSSQLPSYVDDVLEYATVSSFPQTGEDGKIYVAEDTNRQYRWSGTQYVEISPSLALGETSSTAYRGDRGAIAYTHSQTTGNPHNTTAAEVGAVPTSRTVNGHALSDNISLTADDVGARSTNWTPTAADVGAVPTSRTVNGKALSANITLNASDVGAATEADVDGAKPMLRTATLTTSGWSNNSQTVTVSGVVVDKNAQEITVVPDPEDDASWEQWGNAGVRCKSQGNGTLTFIYTASAPTANITVNISIQEVQT